jgi:hypothetical protein
VRSNLQGLPSKKEASPSRGLSGPALNLNSQGPEFAPPMVAQTAVEPEILDKRYLYGLLAAALVMSLFVALRKK